MKKYTIRSTVVDIVCCMGSKILLIKRGKEPFKDRWALPGGYLDQDDVNCAASRELQEETGVFVNPDRFKLVGIYSNFDRDIRHNVSVAVKINLNTAPTIKGGDDAAEARWFYFNELPSPLAFDHDDIIYDFLKQEFK